MAFSPDGHTLATVSEDDQVSLWDLTNPTHPARLGPPLNGPTDYFMSVEFAPKGHTLATLTNGSKVVLWDLTDPAQPGRLEVSLAGPAESDYSRIRFTPDGNTLTATGTIGNNGEGLVFLWDLSGFNNLLGHAVERACSITGGGLDQNEWARRIPNLEYQDTCPK